MCIVYLTVPYWPYWISVRVSPVTIPSNFYVFQLLVIAFVILALLPLLIPMGRLLPMGYALIDKTGDDYGKMWPRVLLQHPGHGRRRRRARVRRVPGAGPALDLQTQHRSPAGAGGRAVAA